MQDIQNNSAEQVIGKLDSWWNTFLENLPNIGVALVVLALTYAASRLLYRVTLKIAYKRLNQTSVTKLLARTVSVVVVLSGLFLALSALNLGKTLTTMLSAAGISGLVIGLALQGTLSNTIAGIVLSIRKNLRLKDWIETNGFAGEVVDIKMNYSVLKEADNNLVVIPNKTILENPLKNFSLTKEMRVTVNCGVGYDSDLEAVEQITLETINTYFNPAELDREVEFYFTEFGDSSINFICRFWIKGESGLDRLKTKSKAIMKIKKAFDREGIDIPFPIRTLQFDNKLHLNGALTKEAISAN